MPKHKPRKGSKTKHRFRLQPHDLAFLEAIAQHRFLRSTHLDALFSRTSSRGIRRRMQLLVQHEYVSVVSVKRRNKQWGGRVPLVYGLKAKARKLLKDADLHSPTRLEWLTRPDQKNPSIDHQLMITDFLVALATEAAQSKDFTFIPPWKMDTEMRTGQKLDLRASVSIDGKRVSLRIIPDAICAIVYKRYGREHTRVVFHEAYRNRNVILTSRSIRRKTIAKTLYGYEELHRLKRTKRYSPHPFTVVVSCNIADRLESIKSLGLNERLFRFFPSDSLITRGTVIQEILGVPLQNE